MDETIDTESLRGRNECTRDWLIRRDLIQNHLSDGITTSRLISLSHCLVNVLVYGCTYPDDTMKELTQLSGPIIDLKNQSTEGDEATCDDVTGKQRRRVYTRYLTDSESDEDDEEFFDRDMSDLDQFDDGLNGKVTEFSTGELSHSLCNKRPVKDVRCKKPADKCNIDDKCNLSLDTTADLNDSAIKVYKKFLMFEEVYKSLKHELAGHTSDSIVDFCNDQMAKKNLCRLMFDYSSHKIFSKSRKGKLTADGVLVARGGAESRRTCKRLVYAQFLNVIFTSHFSMTWNFVDCVYELISNADALILQTSRGQDKVLNLSPECDPHSCNLTTNLSHSTDHDSDTDDVYNINRNNNIHVTTQRKKNNVEQFLSSDVDSLANRERKANDTTVSQSYPQHESGMNDITSNLLHCDKGVKNGTERMTNGRLTLSTCGEFSAFGKGNTEYNTNDMDLTTEPCTRSISSCMSELSISNSSAISFNVCDNILLCFDTVQENSGHLEPNELLLLAIKLKWLASLYHVRYYNNCNIKPSNMFIKICGDNKMLRIDKISRPKKNICICDLYMDGVLVSRGSGATKKISSDEAYSTLLLSLKKLLVRCSISNNVQYNGNIIANESFSSLDGLVAAGVEKFMYQSDKEFQNRTYGSYSDLTKKLSVRGYFVTGPLTLSGSKVSETSSSLHAHKRINAPAVNSIISNLNKHYQSIKQNNFEQISDCMANVQLQQEKKIEKKHDSTVSSEDTQNHISNGMSSRDLVDSESSHLDSSSCIVTDESDIVSIMSCLSVNESPPVKCDKLLPIRDVDDEDLELIKTVLNQSIRDSNSSHTGETRTDECRSEPGSTEYLTLSFSGPSSEAVDTIFPKISNEIREKLLLIAGDYLSGEQSKPSGENLEQVFDRLSRAHDVSIESLVVTMPHGRYQCALYCDDYNLIKCVKNSRACAVTSAYDLLMEKLKQLYVFLTNPTSLDVSNARDINSESEDLENLCLTNTSQNDFNEICINGAEMVKSKELLSCRSQDCRKDDPFLLCAAAQAELSHLAVAFIERREELSEKKLNEILNIVCGSLKLKCRKNTRQVKEGVHRTIIRFKSWVIGLGFGEDISQSVSAAYDDFVSSLLSFHNSYISTDQESRISKISGNSETDIERNACAGVDSRSNPLLQLSSSVKSSFCLMAELLLEKRAAQPKLDTRDLVDHAKNRAGITWKKRTSKLRDGRYESVIKCEGIAIAYGYAERAHIAALIVYDVLVPKLLEFYGLYKKDDCITQPDQVIVTSSEGRANDWKSYAIDNETLRGKTYRESNLNCDSNVADLPDSSEANSIENSQYYKPKLWTPKNTEISKSDKQPCKIKGERKVHDPLSLPADAQTVLNRLAEAFIKRREKFPDKKSSEILQIVCSSTKLKCTKNIRQLKGGVYQTVIKFMGYVLGRGLDENNAKSVEAAYEDFVTNMFRLHAEYDANKCETQDDRASEISVDSEASKGMAARKANAETTKHRSSKYETNECLNQGGKSAEISVVSEASDGMAACKANVKTQKCRNSKDDSNEYTNKGGKAAESSVNSKAISLIKFCKASIDNEHNPLFQLSSSAQSTFYLMSEAFLEERMAQPKLQTRKLVSLAAKSVGIKLNKCAGKCEYGLFECIIKYEEMTLACAFDKQKHIATHMAYDMFVSNLLELHDSKSKTEFNGALMGSGEEGELNTYSSDFGNKRRETYTTIENPCPYIFFNLSEGKKISDTQSSKAKAAHIDVDSYEDILERILIFSGLYKITVGTTAEQHLAENLPSYAECCLNEAACYLGISLKIRYEQINDDKIISSVIVDNCVNSGSLLCNDSNDKSAFLLLSRKLLYDNIDIVLNGNGYNLIIPGHTGLCESSEPLNLVRADPMDQYSEDINDSVSNEKNIIIVSPSVDELLSCFVIRRDDDETDQCSVLEKSVRLSRFTSRVQVEPLMDDEYKHVYWLEGHMVESIVSKGEADTNTRLAEVILSKLHKHCPTLIAKQNIKCPRYLMYDFNRIAGIGNIEESLVTPLDDQCLGYQLLRGLGWDGRSGLGRNGRVYPVIVNLLSRSNNAGLGSQAGNGYVRASQVFSVLESLVVDALKSPDQEDLVLGPMKTFYSKHAAKLVESLNKYGLGGRAWRYKYHEVGGGGGGECVRVEGVRSPCQLVQLIRENGGSNHLYQLIEAENKS